MAKAYRKMITGLKEELSVVGYELRKLVNTGMLKDKSESLKTG